MELWNQNNLQHPPDCMWCYLKNHLTDNSFNCHDADEPKHDATGVKAYLDRKKTPKPTVGHY